MLEEGAIEAADMRPRHGAAMVEGRGDVAGCEVRGEVFEVVAEQHVDRLARGGVAIGPGVEEAEVMADDPEQCVEGRRTPRVALGQRPEPGPEVGPFRGFGQIGLQAGLAGPGGLGRPVRLPLGRVELRLELVVAHRRRRSPTAARDVGQGLPRGPAVDA